MMFGAVASTILTLIAVPLLYFEAARLQKTEREGGDGEGETSPADDGPLAGEVL